VIELLRAAGVPLLVLIATVGLTPAVLDRVTRWAATRAIARVRREIARRGCRRVAVTVAVTRRRVAISVAERHMRPLIWLTNSALRRITTGATGRCLCNIWRANE
jgi:hypothetical protein